MDGQIYISRFITAQGKVGVLYHDAAYSGCLFKGWFVSAAEADEWARKYYGAEVPIIVEKEEV